MNRLTTALVISLLGLAWTGCPASSDEGCDPEDAGTICTIAGNGENGYDHDADERAIPALETKFSLPQDTLVDPDGLVYILDWNNHRLRLLDDDSVTWVAGRGELGGSLDDPENGDFNHPTNIIFDASGDAILMAAWHNSKIRRIELADGSVTDVCGDGKRAYFGDGASALDASFDLPASLALSPGGDLVIMDQANQVLRRVDADGNVHRLAGQCVVDAPAPGGPGPCGDGEMPMQCPDGDNGPSGKLTCGELDEECSKPCTPSYSGDDIPALELRMSQPFGQSASPAGRIAYDSQGRLYFADTGNHLIRMIDEDGMVQRVAGTPPSDGIPQPGYAGDGGAAVDAKLNFPVDIAFGDDGTLYVSDVRNHCIRAIAPDGTIDTVVGVCEQSGFDGDGGPPDEALLNLPFGIEYSDGMLIIADTGNNRIRRVNLP